jgi:hypothetical protein
MPFIGIRIQNLIPDALMWVAYLRLVDGDED